MVSDQLERKNGCDQPETSTTEEKPLLHSDNLRWLSGAEKLAVIEKETRITEIQSSVNIPSGTAYRSCSPEGTKAASHVFI